MTDVSVKQLCDVHTLNLSNNLQLTNISFKLLTNVYNLDLSRNVGITDDVLKLLNVCILNISRCKKITDVGMKELRNVNILNIR